ncbi:S41 family peptidase [Chitinophaga sp. Hz27]|uniref:S41 family peptidase n=1 Tax=Chitinophaga sp. Hz27 TaxID=3347169 RepID=UPI0035D8FDE0
MKKCSLILFMILCACTLKGQNCNCANDFRFMTEKVKENYVGYFDKVTAANLKRFNHYTDSLQDVAAHSDTHECLFVLRAWLRFFEDLHMNVMIKEDTSNYDIIRKAFRNAEITDQTNATFAAYLHRNRQHLDSLEGIWEDETKTYQLGIMKQEHAGVTDFSGFMMKADSIFWFPRQIKMQVQKTNSHYKVLSFYTRDHSVAHPTIAVSVNTLNLGLYGIWHKVFPKDSAYHPITQAKYREPWFKVLDPQHCLLVMPSFGLAYKPLIDSLIAANKEVLSKTEELIIDVRNNGGGSVLCVENLLPYIYTGPIITTGASVRATSDNIRDYYAITDYPNVSDSMKAVFRKEAAELQAHVGTFYHLWPGDTLILPTKKQYPARVAVIVNENSASSTELFVLKARQSSKVKIYGAHTMGAVDYADVVTSKMPCSIFVLRYPTSCTDRPAAERIDNKGIQPDVKIDDSITDWVEYVRTADSGK